MAIGATDVLGLDVKRLSTTVTNLAEKREVWNVAYLGFVFPTYCDPQKYFASG
jgi:hypothetical protein